MTKEFMRPFHHLDSFLFSVWPGLCFCFSCWEQSRAQRRAEYTWQPDKYFTHGLRATAVCFKQGCNQNTASRQIRTFHGPEGNFSSSNTRELYFKDILLWCLFFGDAVCRIILKDYELNEICPAAVQQSVSQSVEVETESSFTSGGSP